MDNGIVSPRHSTDSYWVTVDKRSPSPLQRKVYDVFQKRIQPLYGPQDAQVAKLLAGEDRKVRLLFVPERSEQAAGLLAYKRDLVSEEEGCERAFEVKTATLTDPVEFRGCGRLLVERAERAARTRGAACIQLTVAGDATPERQAVRRWFEDQGFQLVRQMPEGTYREHEVEIVLKKPMMSVAEPARAASPVQE